MWVCSTTLARGLPPWMRAWMKKAVASTWYLPSTMVPAPSAITRSEGVISDQCRPCGLTRNRSSRPGTVMLKWLHTPSFRPCRAAARSAVVRSIRAWVTGSLASIKRSPLPKDVTSGDDAAKPAARPSEIESSSGIRPAVPAGRLCSGALAASGRSRPAPDVDTGDLAHQLGAHGAAEMVEIVGHDHERTRSADD